MSYILPGAADTKYHLTPRPHNFMLTAKKDLGLSLNVILLPGCSLKTFIDIVLFSLLFYVFSLHAFLLASSFIHRYFITFIGL